jgi:hypothetical protein
MALYEDETIKSGALGLLHGSLEEVEGFCGFGEDGFEGSSNSREISRMASMLAARAAVIAISVDLPVSAY